MSATQTTSTAEPNGISVSGTAIPTPASGTVSIPAHQEPKPEERKFTQAELDAIVKDRLAREQAQREKAEAKAREEAEAKALVDQQQFRELAEKQAKQIARLEEQAAAVEQAQSQTERYKTALTSILETQRQGIPAPIISLLDRMDPVEQLEWIAANQDAVAPQRGGTGAIPPSPRGTPAPLPAKEQLIAEEKQRRRAAGYYGI